MGLVTMLRRFADFGENGVAIEANEMIEDLLAKYPHDHVIAAVFSAMRARCDTPESFMAVAECAAEAFGPTYRQLTAEPVSRPH